MKETRDQLESSRARYAFEAQSYRRSMVKLHNRLRLLENAIRGHVEGQCPDSSGDDCLLDLYRRVPVRPRKKIR